MEYVEQLSLDGKQSCMEFFHRQCEPICFVKVRVPKSNAFILSVAQSQGNIEKVFVNFYSVNLSEVYISGDGIQVAMHNTTTTTKTTIKTNQRTIFVGSRLTYGAVSASLIQMTYPEDSEIDMWHVNHRAVTYPNRVCVAGANTTEKNIDDVISDCLVTYANKIANTFDPEGSRRITREKIANALDESGKCCGTKCPRKSYCAAVADQIIPFGVSYVSVDEFFNLLNTSSTDYTVIPKCMRYTSIQPDTNILTLQEELYLTSIEGGIQVVVEKGFNSSALREPQRAVDNIVNLSPVLTMSSFKEIRSSITDVYEAEAPASDAGYGVFYFGYNVFAGLTGDIFDKFMYTDRSFYVSIPPALLNALTMGLATPQVIIQEPIIVADGCGLGPYDSSTLSIGNALLEAIQASPTSVMRGDLLRLTAESSMPFAYLQTIAISVSGDPIVKIFLHQSTTFAALILGLCIASVTSLLILYKFDTLMRIQLERAVEAHRVRANMMDSVDTAFRDRRVRIENVHHVLENPVELIDIFIVEPARRYFTDSLSGFIYATYNVKVVKQRSLNFVYESTPKILPCEEQKPVYNQLLRDTNDMTFTDFMCEYENYCVSRKLDMEEDPTVVKRRLFEILNVKIRNWNVERIAGCEFLGENLNPASIEDIDQSQLGDDFYLFLLYARHDLVLTGKMNDFVNIDDMTNSKANDVKSKMVLGVRTRFRLFCSNLFAKYNAPDRVVFVPDTLTFENDDRLKRLGLKRHVNQIQTIRGLSLNTDDSSVHRSTFTIRRYFIIVMETILHVLALTILPIIIFVFFLVVETFISSSSYVPEEPSIYGISMADFWDWKTLFQLRFYDLDQWLRTIWSICVGAFIACNFNLIIVYSGVIKSGSWVSWISRVMFRVMFSLVLFVWCAIFIWQCIWVMVCAFVNPQKYLPFGTAVFVFFTIVLTELFKIMRVRRKLKEYTESVYKKIIFYRFRDAIEMMYQVDDSPDMERLDATVRASAEPIIDADSIFDFLNYKSKSPDLEGLSRSEFYLMFEVLQINALPHKQASLFAYCDTSADDSVSRDEFKEAWSWLMDKLAEDLVAKGFGMSNFEIFLYLLMISLIIMGVLAFFLLTLPELSSNDSFDSIVQSSILAGGSQMATHMHSSFAGLSETMKMASESSDQLEKAVNGKVKAQTEQALN